MSERTTTPVELDTLTDLQANAVRNVAEALNTIPADFFAIHLKTKNFHWHASGPHFRDHHLMLDERAEELFAVTDEVAERVRKSGNTTLRSVGDIARHQTIRDNDHDFVAPGVMLRELRADNLKMVESLRYANQIAEAAKDNATSAAIDYWTDQAERRAWFLFEASRGT